ncbi:MAG: hypothetical protein LBE13_00315 [Bacteroidales bacterium]|jgi:DNA-directed RNA polymerase subunit RPC12/RpoP|nr:hypothetical protein [Bacteroidales bacterium]
MKIDIYIACPICSSGGRYTMSPEYWRHYGSCQGRLQIDEYAYVSCARCGKRAHITQMRFNCPAQRHTFSVPTTSGLSEAFSISSQMVNAAGNRWFISVIKHIGD